MPNTEGLKEVLDMIFEFVLSLVVILGGGYLLYLGKATDVVISLVSVVITFWFSRRSVGVAGGIISKIKPAAPAAPANVVNEIPTVTLTQGGTNNGN